VSAALLSLSTDCAPFPNPLTRYYYPSTSLRETVNKMPSISYQPILDAALADYSKQVGIDLATHPLADSLRSCGSPDDVLKLLENKTNEFKDFRDENRKLFNWLSPVVQAVYTLSAVLGVSITLVSRNILVLSICFFFTNPVTRFRSNQQRRYLLASMFSSQCVSH